MRTFRHDLWLALNPKDLLNKNQQYYSVDEGLSWTQTENVNTFILEGSGNSIWNTDLDLPDVDINNVYFKIVPFDADLGQEGVTELLNIDNLHSQSLLFPFEVNGEQTESVDTSTVEPGELRRSS